MKKVLLFLLFVVLFLATACSAQVPTNRPAAVLPSVPKQSLGLPATPTLGLLTPTIVAATPTPKPPSFQIRAAFYYPWFPEAWKQQGFNPFTNYNPSLGFYDSGATAVIQDHLQALTYGGFQAAILSWWGQGSPTDLRVPTILAAISASSNPNFRIALYYENESVSDPTVSTIQSDLTYIRDHYSQNASYLHVDGRFVVFVYSGGNDGCGMADRWVQANQELGNPAYVVLRVFPGYKACSSQSDSWHQYAPAGAVKEEKGYSITISPGFYKKGDPSPRLARDVNAWAASVQAMLASGEPWQLVTTFNEWGEGTAVESAQQWSTPSGFGAYLDILHQYVGNLANK